MAYWIVDTKDKEAQRVSADASTPGESRFVKVCADTASEAFSRAGIRRVNGVLLRGNIPEREYQS